MRTKKSSVAPIGMAPAIKKSMQICISWSSEGQVVTFTVSRTYLYNDNVPLTVAHVVVDYLNTGIFVINSTPAMDGILLGTALCYLTD
jgi:hypothetical protein